MAPSASPPGSPPQRRELEDPRRAVDYKSTVKRQVSPSVQALKEDCQMLKARESRDHESRASDELMASPSLGAKMSAKIKKLNRRLCSSGGVPSCVAGIGALFPMLQSSASATPTDSPNEDHTLRRWYRVHPISDELYFVRPDPGVAGRTPGHPDAGMLQAILEEPHNPGSDPVQSRLKRNKDRSSPTSSPNLGPGRSPMHSRINSVPCDMDRMCGLEEPSFNDTFVNFCKLCCDNHAELVFLPCRHGGICEECLRRTAISRALNKFGTRCPFCRKTIAEVIKIYDEGAIKMYGYAITKPSRYL